LSNEKNDIDYFLWRLQLLLPLIFISIIIFGTLLLAIFKTNLERSWSYLVSIIIIIHMRYVPILVSPLILMMDCKKFKRTDDLKDTVLFRRWSAYPQYDCSADIHQFHEILSIISLIVIIVVIHGVYCLVLYRKRSDLNDSELRYKYGFLYNDYKPEYFFWEIIKSFLKIGLVIFSVLDVKFTVRIIALILLFILYYLLTNKCRPYQTNALNEIDKEAAISVIVTLQMIFLLKPEENTLYEVIGHYLGYAIIAGVNGYFVVRMIAILINEYFESLRVLILGWFSSKRLERILSQTQAALTYINPLGTIRRKAELMEVIESIEITESNKAQSNQKPYED
jgi:hypothetical protein